MTIKDRLLEAIGDIPDLSQDVLTDLLIEKAELLRAELATARLAIAKELQRADDIEKAYQRELHDMRPNPLAAAAGDYYFYDQYANAGYAVTITGHRNIRLVKRTGRIDLTLQRISADQWASRVSKGII